MKTTRFTLTILFAALICLTGCVSTKDPVAGWKVLLSRDYEKLDPAITNDYKDYIEKLSAEDRKYAGPIWFFADGTGQHAVKIEIEYDGNIWEHVLIYDKDNKRNRVVKYFGGRYQS